jgi:hypothetical protein
VIAFATSIDFQSDFERSALAGTIFYGFITLICLSVAAWGSAVRFDGAEKLIRFERRFAGIRVGSEETPAASVRAVILQGVKFLKDSEQPQPGLLNTRFRSYVARRNVYYKLYLEFEEKRRILEDSTDIADLEAAGTRIAQFLGVDYRREEL